MRAALAVLGLALAGLVLQSAAATELPAHAIPDLGLLVTVAGALLLPAVPGLAVAAAAGFAADVLSGSLLGQHALLRLLEFAGVRALGGQLDLLRAGPFVALALGVTLVDALGMAGLSRLFLGAAPSLPRALALVAAQLVANAALAGPVVVGVRAVAERALASPAGRGRPVRLETRRSSP